MTNDRSVAGKVYSLRSNGRKPGRIYEPTRKDIEKACARIQATWDESVERKRETGLSEEQHYTIPEVSMRYLEEAIGDSSSIESV